MGLLQNGYRDNIGTFRFAGATASNGSVPSSLPVNTHLTGSQRNITAGEGITSDKVGIPCGYYMGGSWVFPQKAGLISSHNATRLSISSSADGVMGMPGSGSVTITISTNNPAGGLIVSGSGSASLEVSTNTPLLTAVISGSGSATITVETNDPILGAIASMIGDAIISMSGTLQPYGVGLMSGSTSGGGDMTEASIAARVWSDSSADSIIKLLGADVEKNGDIITIKNPDGSPWRQYDLANGGRVLV